MVWLFLYSCCVLMLFATIPPCMCFSKRIWISKRGEEHTLFRRLGLWWLCYRHCTNLFHVARCRVCYKVNFVLSEHSQCVDLIKSKRAYFRDLEVQL